VCENAYYIYKLNKQKNVYGKFYLQLIKYFINIMKIIILTRVEISESIIFYDLLRDIFHLYVKNTKRKNQL